MPFIILFLYHHFTSISTPASSPACSLFSTIFTETRSLFSSLLPPLSLQYSHLTIHRIYSFINPVSAFSAYICFCFSISIPLLLLPHRDFRLYFLYYLIMISMCT